MQNISEEAEGSRSQESAESVTKSVTESVTEGVTGDGGSRNNV